MQSSSWPQLPSLIPVGSKRVSCVTRQAVYWRGTYEDYLKLAEKRRCGLSRATGTRAGTFVSVCLPRPERARQRYLSFRGDILDVHDNILGLHAGKSFNRLRFNPASEASQMRLSGPADPVSHHRLQDCHQLSPSGRFSHVQLMTQT